MMPAAPFVGAVYGVVAALAGLAFLAQTYTLRKHADKRRAWRTFKASGVYLLVLLIGLVLSTL